MNEFEEFNSNQKLPNDPLALILGIGSIIFSLLGCCCGAFTAVPGFLIGIIAWLMASKALKEYSNNPNYYNLTSYNNTKTAKILAIIGTILGLILGIFTLLWFVGVMAQPEILEEMRSTIEQMQQNQ